MQGEIFDGHVRHKRSISTFSESALSRPTRYGLSAHRRYSENREEPATFDNPPERRELRRWCFLEDLVAFGEHETHDCLLRVQMCRVGRSHELSSSVPARTRITPSRAGPAIHEPHSGQTHRMLVLPLSARR